MEAKEDGGIDQPCSFRIGRIDRARLDVARPGRAGVPSAERGDGRAIGAALDRSIKGYSAPRCLST
jgi:hypothetical protein